MARYDVYIYPAPKAPIEVRNSSCANAPADPRAINKNATRIVFLIPFSLRLIYPSYYTIDFRALQLIIHQKSPPFSATEAEAIGRAELDLIDQPIPPLLGTENSESVRRRLQIELVEHPAQTDLRVEGQPASCP
jgi:hypothetical protein